MNPTARVMTRPSLDETREIYNSLPSVESASARLAEESTFSAFLEEYAEIAGRHDFLGVVGVFLLHRHFHLAPSRLIVEAPRAHESGPTQAWAAPAPVTEKELGELCATRWGFHEGGESSFPLEFGAHDPLAMRVAGSSTFLREVGSLLAAYSFEDLLGLATVHRPFMMVDDGQQYVELSTDEASITSVADRTEVSTDWLGTLWAPDEVGRCEPQWTCRSRCIPAGQMHHHEHPHVPTGHSHIP